VNTDIHKSSTTPLTPLYCGTKIDHQADMRLFPAAACLVLPEPRSISCPDEATVL